MKYLNNNVKGKAIDLEYKKYETREVYLFVKYPLTQIFLNIEFLKNGYAKFQKDRNSIYINDFEIAEQEAQNKQIGIWNNNINLGSNNRNVSNKNNQKSFWLYFFTISIIVAFIYQIIDIGQH